MYLLPVSVRPAVPASAFAGVIRAVFLLLAVFLTVLVHAVPARADAAQPYATEIASVSSAFVTMEPGSEATFTVTFRNLGDRTWMSDGPGFISVYTYAPKYRMSAFRHASWHRQDQPARISEAVVPPGATGTIRITLRAPMQQGRYAETFHLAAEDVAWIPGGQFIVNIVVGSPGTTSVAPVVAPAAPAPSPTPVSATAPRFRAERVDISPPAVTVAPGGKAAVSIRFRNTGSEVWRASGSAFVSVYTYGPKYRSSVFRDAAWHGATQPARISPPNVAPGEIGTITIPLSAPSAPGTHAETFYLAAEDTTWIPGGLFTVPIAVTATAASSQPTTPTSPAPSDGTMTPILSSTASGYQATMLLASAKSLELSEGALTTFRVGLKNTGEHAWTAVGARQVKLSAEDGNAFSFRHASWPGANVAASLPAPEVKPGQLAFFDVTLAAPSGQGEYFPRFALTAGSERIEGGTVEIPIRVLRGEIPASVSGNIPSFGGLPDRSGPRGPNIRVGLFETRQPITFVADGTYTLVDGSTHTDVRQLSGMTTVTFDFGSRTYHVRNGGYSGTFTHHIHLRPDDPERTIFEIPSFESRAAWDSSVNFNRFRGELEVFYSPTADELWVIEELPLEDYMRGLAETSNGSHFEYQKTLVTAARTFAYFVQRTGGKHPTKHFDVATDAGDQVYKGYVSELIRPNVVRAVEETRGMIVTLGADVVATPYFSRSDGRTRAFTEVWGGSTRSWLVSVPTPYDVGKTLWGHGVGMSASDALARAENGATWTDILKYYYTGTDITRRY